MKNDDYTVTALGGIGEPFVLERSKDPIVFTPETEFRYQSGEPTRLFPVLVRGDMPSWPAPKRLTRRQTELRRVIKTWLRRTAAGVPHREAFVAIVDGMVVLV